MFRIYIAINTVSGKVYVGQTLNPSKRRSAHVKGYYDSFLSRALRKYGAQSFEWYILSQVQTKAEADDIERFWISVLRSDEREFGYNLTYGGSGSFGNIISEETRRKHSISFREQWALGIRKPNKGWHHSAESKAKISAANKGRYFGRRGRRVCAVDGCGKDAHAHGMCAPHLHRQKRYGSPLLGRPFGIKGPPKGVPYGPRKRAIEVVA